MIDKIIGALGDCGIAMWRINDTITESNELFFVRRRLDVRRAKDVRFYRVTVFRKTESDGKPQLAFTVTTLYPGMSDADVRRKLGDAYSAALNAANPAYALPDAEQSSKPDVSGSRPLTDIAAEMTKALFAADTDCDAFVNSAELFVTRTAEHILSSEGTDVYELYDRVTGEFVVQCPQPEDVEMHHSFNYDSPDAGALTEYVRESLRFVRDRARAKRVLKSGRYTLVLTGKHIGTVLNYYAERSHASMIYAGYSTWKTGADIQGETEGERMELTLRATRRFSAEGIAMRDLELVRDGRLLALHGGNRFCRYLGVKPTGDYDKISCGCGTESFEAMKREPCLWVVSFSDFQTDVMSGHFGGEIRMAYLFDGNGGVTPVTGGSVNGSIIESQKNIVFSTERFDCAGYSGPYAMKLADISVAGND